MEFIKYKTFCRSRVSKDFQWKTLNSDEIIFKKSLYFLYFSLSLIIIIFDCLFLFKEQCKQINVMRISKVQSLSCDAKIHPAGEWSVYTSNISSVERTRPISRKNTVSSVEDKSPLQTVEKKYQRGQDLSFREIFCCRMKMTDSRRLWTNDW